MGLILFRAGAGRRPMPWRWTSSAYGKTEKAAVKELTNLIFNQISFAIETGEEHFDDSFCSAGIPGSLGEGAHSRSQGHRC